MYFKDVLKAFHNINKKILKIMKYGLSFSFGICIISTAILCTYLLFYHSNFLYMLGINAFRIGTIFAVEFIVCGMSVDAITSRGW